MALIKKLFSFVIMLGVMMAVSCSDDDDNGQNPDPEDCKVTAYRCGNRDESWVIVYNESGSIDSIKIGNYEMTSWSEIRTFSYNQLAGESSITVKKYSYGTLYETSEVELGDMGKILSIRDISPVTEVWEQRSYGYRVDMPTLVDKDMLSFDGSDNEYASYYQWEAASPVGWNMTNYNTDGGDYEYEYNLNKTTQPGDFQNFDKITSTYDKYHRPFSSANLLKAIYYDGELDVEITYTFDSDDKITSFSADWEDSSSDTWEITYECE